MCNAVVWSTSKAFTSALAPVAAAHRSTSATDGNSRPFSTLATHDCPLPMREPSCCPVKPASARSPLSFAAKAAASVVKVAP